MATAASSMVKRGAIAITGVKFTQKEPHATRGHFKLSADTKRRLEECAQSKYGEFK